MISRDPAKSHHHMKASAVAPSSASIPLTQSSSWLEVRLFYVRIAPCVVENVPDSLTLRHPRRETGASLEVNGARVPPSETASLKLRRDRVDRESSEVTYVSTEAVRVTGCVDFEVYDKEEMVLCGNLDRIEGAWDNGTVSDPKTGWGMDCYMALPSSSSSSSSSPFFRPKLGVASPSLEVYIAGCCGGVPVILTKTIQASPRRKVARHVTLDAIPEDEEEVEKDDLDIVTTGDEFARQQQKVQMMESEDVDEYDDESEMKMGQRYYYPEGMYVDEDGELTWFNAGVRVGVGIGLGMCLGVGIGVGLLMRSYQATTSNLRRSIQPLAPKISKISFTPPPPSGVSEKKQMSKIRPSATMSHREQPSPASPLVVTLNCVEDCALEQDSLSGVAGVEYVPLSRIADGKIESATAVLLHSLAYLPRAAQRRLRPHQLILCLGSADRAVDSTLAADLGLRLVHVDTSRAEEIADTVMALILGLLRRTHLLSRHALSASGWLGSLQPLCRGMRRCRGMVLGIIGRSVSARYLASRSLAFKMSVLYFDVPEGEEERIRPSRFPRAARRMDTLNDLLAASDVISLHCALTDNTVQILNAECLQHIKPGAFLVNTGSCQLLDDCAVKQLLIDGTIAGCAIDGAEGPQWMEAWVKEMPNVLILPRSADYSEEVWMEIREKAISILQSFFLDGVIPTNTVSDEEVEETEDEEVSPIRRDKLALVETIGRQQGESTLTSTEIVPVETSEFKESLSPGQLPEVRRSRSGKKAKKRHSQQKYMQRAEGSSGLHEDGSTSRRDDIAMSDSEEVLSSSSRCVSPEDSSRSRKTPLEVMQQLSSSQNQLVRSSKKFIGKSSELLKDGYVIAMYAKDLSGLHVSRQRTKNGGWFLDTLSNVSKRDPAAQFIIAYRNKDTVGLRSFAAGGKLLQINRRMEFVFASHSFDVWESWSLEGSLDECRLVNCRNSSASLEVRVEILAMVGDDGVTRWID
ncbi:C-terminal binding protein AN [Hirschfeldia incana]|nr:C-terminal binding protein AN [Hirschfeldia incana]